MGAKNSMSYFVALSVQLKRKWTQKYHSEGLQMIEMIVKMYQTLTPDELSKQVEKIITAKPEFHFLTGDPYSVAIVDDSLWAATTMPALMAYFQCALEIYK